MFALLGYPCTRYLLSDTATSGLSLTAQGCCTRLPWDAVSVVRNNPDGVETQSPRLLYSATLGNSVGDSFQPQRGCGLVPNITFVPFHVMFVEQCAKLVLKTQFSMMHFLVYDVVLYQLQIGETH
jgi:hypothetical protein